MKVWAVHCALHCPLCTVPTLNLKTHFAQLWQLISKNQLDILSSRHRPANFQKKTLCLRCKPAKIRKCTVMVHCAMDHVLWFHRKQFSYRHNAFKFFPTANQSQGLISCSLIQHPIGCSERSSSSIWTCGQGMSTFLIRMSTSLIRMSTSSV